MTAWRRRAGACSTYVDLPQAWAAAGPLLLLRALPWFDPDLPAGLVHRAPAVPAHMLPLRVHGLQLGGSSVDRSLRCAGRRVATWHHPRPGISWSHRTGVIGALKH